MAVATGTVQVTETLVAEQCNTCSVIYGLPDGYIEDRRRDKKWWYCPNGHQWHYDENEEDRLRKRLREKDHALNATQDRWNDEKKAHTATKGKLTKARKRGAAGVCQFCHRTFQQVARHVQSKHSDEVAVPA